MALSINLPAYSKEIVGQIENLIKTRAQNVSAKVEMEKAEVSEANIDKFIEQKIKQFKNTIKESEREAFDSKLRGLTFCKRNDQLSFGFEIGSATKGSNMLLILSLKDKENVYNIFIYSYTTTCEFSSISKIFRGLFGFPENESNNVLNEENMKMFLIYKLAKYASEFQKGVQINFTSNNLTYQ